MNRKHAGETCPISLPSQITFNVGSALLAQDVSRKLSCATCGTFSCAACSECALVLLALHVPCYFVCKCSHAAATCSACALALPAPRVLSRYLLCVCSFASTLLPLRARLRNLRCMCSCATCLACALTLLALHVLLRTLLCM